MVWGRPLNLTARKVWVEGGPDIVLQSNKYWIHYNTNSLAWGPASRYCRYLYKSKQCSDLLFLPWGGTGAWLLHPAPPLPSVEVLHWNEYNTNMYRAVKKLHIKIPSPLLPLNHSIRVWDAHPSSSLLLVALTTGCLLPLEQSHSSDNQHLTRWSWKVATASLQIGHIMDHHKGWIWEGHWCTGVICIQGLELVCYTHFSDFASCVRNIALWHLVLRVIICLTDV